MTIGDIVPWRWGSLGQTSGRPFEDFRGKVHSLHRAIDRLYENTWAGEFTSLFSETARTRELATRMDVEEDAKAFRVTIELPGVTDKDVAVSLTDRLLTIRGEKKEVKERKDKDAYRSERRYGSFRRTLELPGDVREQDRSIVQERRADDRPAKDQGSSGQGRANPGQSSLTTRASRRPGAFLLADPAAAMCGDKMAPAGSPRSSASLRSCSSRCRRSTVEPPVGHD